MSVSDYVNLGSEEVDCCGPVWTTKDGTQIRIYDMMNRHLVNTLRMLRRSAEGRYQDDLALVFGFASTCRGDGAAYAADQACDDMCLRTDWRDYVPDIFWDMESLARERCIEWKQGV
jgi:hypothetical protein